MKNRKVKELMIPLEDYVTVNQNATLSEAVLTLRNAWTKKGPHKYHHHAVLAIDDNGKVVGKLSMHDTILALEPGYRGLFHPGYNKDKDITPKYIKDSLEQYAIWQAPLEDLCQKGGHYLVKDVMQSPHTGHPISENASLAEAAHAMILGRNQSLIVINDQNEVVGVLRLTDLFLAVADALAACEF